LMIKSVKVRARSQEFESQKPEQFQLPTPGSWLLYGIMHAHLNARRAI
jgi:hypothetical protein